MNIYKKLDRERIANIFKIYFTMGIMLISGIFLYALIQKGFFIGWESYFAVACFAAILLILLIFDADIVRWLHYDIIFKDDRIKIRDSMFERAISVPINRIYYVSTQKAAKKSEYDSIIIFDKRVNHKKVRRLDKSDFRGESVHLNVINELKNDYPEKVFYYYRVYHHGYKFLYFFYLLYRNCERCKFTDSSMELIKKVIE
ncbi:MAG: hypothetical protein QME45_02835 [Clostridiales bacterium]|nr:hypothetical protein [Clostridiales bacterium]HBM79776.1 hypothetical protein [Clostridiaceae bacterium]